MAVLGLTPNPSSVQDILRQAKKGLAEIARELAYEPLALVVVDAVNRLADL